MWRILATPKLTVTLRELETSWSFSDLMDAHDVLDALEDAEARASVRG